MKIPWTATFKFRILLLGLMGWVALCAIIIFLGVFSEKLKGDLDQSLQEIQDREGKRLLQQRHAQLHQQMRRKTLDVARELSLYLKLHQSRSWEELRRDPEFRQTAVQTLGPLGKTFLLTPQGQRILLHGETSREGQDLAQLVSYPRLFQFLEDFSRRGRWPAGYFEEQGDHHAFFVPVEVRLAGGPPLMVGAVADLEEMERSGFNNPCTVLKTSINLSRSLIMTRLRHFQKEIFLLLGGLGLLGLLASLALIRKQTKEINALTGAAEAYNAGNLEHRIPPLGHSELGRLAQTLNRMADSLRENTVSRVEWENTFNILPDQIMVLDAEQRVLRVNRAAVDYLGLPPAQILGRHCYELMHASGSMPHSCPLKQAIRQRCEGRGEILTDDGRTFLVTATPCGEAQEGIRGAVHVARDITGFKQMQRELGQTSHFLNHIIDTAPIAVAVVNQRGRFTHVNPQFFAEYGYASKEILGQPYARLYASRVEMCRVLTELRDNGEILNYRASFRHKSGRTIPTRISVRNLWDADGSLLGSVALGSNISAEISLQQQMEQVQKLEAVATLSGGLAHNFNNLLSIIMGLTDLMLSKTSQDDEFFDDLKEIELQVRAGRELTQNLLAFARGTRFEMQPLSLNELARSTADMFGRTRRDLQILQDLAADLPLVEVDAGQIQQVLMNFLINAWQAMPGGGKIRLRTRTVNVTQWHDPAWELNAPGLYVGLSVIDQGEGMDKETLSHIFEPFFTTKPPGQGTGLGLSSAYRIIKSHHGAIQVKSRKGRGTTFNILLPASQAQPRALPDEESPIIHGRGTILVVDDEAVLRRVASRLLEKLGYQVVAAESGEKALQLLQEPHTEIDLVLLDVVMPGLNGFQTLERLRGLRPELRVLLCSGYGDGKGGKLPDDVGFLAKPYSLKFLSLKVAAALK